MIGVFVLTGVDFWYTIGKVFFYNNIMEQTNGRGAKLRTLMSKGVFALGVSSAMDAMIAKLAGHECLYLGGYAAAALRGRSDYGIIGGTEMLQAMMYVAEATDLPAVADIDDGYGSTHNVIRTVTDMLTKTNVAGIHIEDQKYPKRCGHIAGKEVLPMEEFLGKLRAALDTRDRVDYSRVVIARTDAFSAAGAKKDPRVGGDIDEALRRGLAYARAGADSVWCEFPTPSRESAKAFAEGMKACMPTLGLSFNLSPSFFWPAEEHPMTLRELQSFGYTFVFSTYPSLLASMYAVYENAKEFRAKDPVEALILLQSKIKGTPVESAMKVLGVDRYQEAERAYSPSAAEKQRTSDGFKGEEKK